MPIGVPVAIPVPLGGRPYGVPAHLVRDDQLADATNVAVEKRALIDRRGYDRYGSVDVPGTPGLSWESQGLFFVPAFTSGGVIANGLMLGVLSDWYHTFGPDAAWEDVTALSGPSFQTRITETFREIGITGQRVGGRSAVMQVGGVKSTVMISGGNGDIAIYFKYTDDPTADKYTNITNSPQGGRDIITSAGRLVIGLCGVTAEAGATEIHFSAVNDLETWPTGLFAVLDDFPGLFVGFATINRTSFAILKRDSQLIATATPNAAFPFRFDELAFVSGPVSANAIVRAGNDSYWLGFDGGIYRLRGSNVDEVSPTTKHLMKDDFIHGQMYYAHGAYNEYLHQIWWWYPGISGGKGDIVSFPVLVAKNMLIYDIESNTAWYQSIEVSETTGGIWASLGAPAADHANAPLGTVVLADDPLKLLYIVRDGRPTAYDTDDVVVGDFVVERGDGGGPEAASGLAIDASFQTAVRAYAGPQKKTIIRGYIPMFRKEATAANLITIDFLGGDHPDALSTLDTKIVDPSADERIAIDGLCIEANWVSIKHSWTVESDHSRIWDGGILYVDAIDEGLR